MDLSHRIPYPDPKKFYGIFREKSVNVLYSEIQTKNLNKISDGLTKILTFVPDFNEFELFVSLNAARNILLNFPIKVKKEVINFILSLSKIGLTEHFLPYLLIFSNDCDQQVKKDSGAALVSASKKCGGLKKNKQILVSGIGSLGMLCIKDETSSVDIIINRSKLACSCVLSAVQILKLMMNDLQRKEIAELLQFLSTYTEKLQILLKDFDQIQSSDTLFFSPRLRGCLYSLYTLTHNIEKCPTPDLQSLIYERDHDCMSSLIPLVKLKLNNENYGIILENELLLDEFFELYIEFCTNKELSELFELNISNENIIKLFQHLDKRNLLDSANLTKLTSIPELWDKLPENLLKCVLSKCSEINSCYVLKYYNLFSNILDFQFSSDSKDEEISKVVNLLVSKDDLPSIIKHMPDKVLCCIKNWTKSPKTDWFCDEFMNNIELFLTIDPNITYLAIPDHRKEDFGVFVSDHLMKLYSSKQFVDCNLWNYVSVTDDLCMFILKNNVPINASKERLQDLYKELFERTYEQKPDSGAIIGKYVQSLSIHFNYILNDYDFLKSFFSVAQLSLVDENVAIKYIDDYLRIEIPDFFMLLLSKSFTFDLLQRSIFTYINDMKATKKYQLISTTMQCKLLNSTLIFIFSFTDFDSSQLKIPDDYLPYVALINEEYIRNFDSEYCKFIRNEYFDPKKISDEFKLFISPHNDAFDCEHEILYKCFCDSPTILTFNLFLETLYRFSTVGVPYFHYFLDVLHFIDSIQQNSHISAVIKKLILTVNTKEEIISLFDKASELTNKKILNVICYEYMTHLVCVFKGENMLNLREALSKFSYSHLIEFDKCVSKLISKDNIELITKFPNAASIWFSGISNRATSATDPSETRLDVGSCLSELTSELVKDLLGTLDDFKTENLHYKITGNIIHCEIRNFDDIFRMQITIPDNYPLMPVNFYVSEIGKDKLTLDTTDDVKKAFIRTNNLRSSIEAWKESIESIINNEASCPICLCLLDSSGNLPKLRCSICHQSCHSSCMNTYNKKSFVRRKCPWCRADWKRQK